MKTLNDTKNEIAVEHSFKNWKDLFDQMKAGVIGRGYYSILFELVAKRYAEQAIDAVCDHLKHYEHENNFPDGQTEITDNMLAVGNYGDGRDGDIMVWIDKQSILKLKEEFK